MPSALQAGRPAAPSIAFGDGGSAEGARAKHVFDRPGTYRVGLTVRDATDKPCGVSADTMVVVINAPPLALAGNDTAVVVGGAHDEIWFDGSRSSDPDGGTLTYEWNFGDRQKAEGARVRHVYRRPGQYTVRLKVTDQTRCNCSSSETTFKVVARKRDATTRALPAEPARGATPTRRRSGTAR